MQGTGLRRLRWAAGLAVSALALLLMPVPSSYAAGHGSYVTEPSPGSSLAGSRAGVGRTPPGRPMPAPTPPAALPPPPPPAAVPTPTPSEPERPSAARQAVVPRGTGPLVNVLPLGAGLLLTGCGIAFLALRLRR
ncbi:hypothetical protein ACIBL6_33795 [Streptomyces sp. NPDC050400]|uniref:hypothetical protein n=1 Tax=Streptomyces sp. NPDC050400 TaxID=3365610 RepID=UPI00379DF9B8